MRLYTTAPNGQVHIRNTDTRYSSALVAMTNDKKESWVISWHSRPDLARKAQGRYHGNPMIARTFIRSASQIAPAGQCGHCNGTGLVKCSKCNGRIEYDVTDHTYETAPGPRPLPFIREPRGYMLTIKTRRHVVCKCSTTKTPGKIKCHVCRGKGTIA